jgi:hypothetical protein
MISCMALLLARGCTAIAFMSASSTDRSALVKVPLRQQALHLPLRYLLLLLKPL